MMKTVVPRYDEIKKQFFEFSNSDQRDLFVNNYKQKLLAIINQRGGNNDIELVVEVESTEKRRSSTPTRRNFSSFNRDTPI